MLRSYLAMPPRRGLRLVALLIGFIVVVLGLLSSTVQPAQSQPFQVTGTVVTPDGTPYSGAVAVLEPRQQAQDAQAQRGSDPKRAVSTASSDEDGYFRLLAPSQGRWRVTVQATGMLPMHRHLDLDAAQHLPTLTLTPARPLQIEVTRAAAIPLEQVRVQVSGSQPSGFAWSPASREGRTDQDGLLLVPRGPGEELRVHVQAAGHQSETRTLRADDPTSAIRLDLAPTTAVTGRIQAPDRRPIAGAEIRLQRQGAGVGAPHVAYSRRNGEFAIQGLTPGAYWVQVSAEGHGAQEASVDVVEQRPLEDLLVVLEPR